MNLISPHVAVAVLLSALVPAMPGEVPPWDRRHSSSPWQKRTKGRCGAKALPSGWHDAIREGRKRQRKARRAAR